MAERLYLVTGAAGHLGNTVVMRLAAAGERVRALVLPGEELPPGLSENAEIFEGDIRDRKSLAEFFCAPGRELCVIHCAGIVSISSGYSKAVHEVNVGGTRNIVRLCERQGVKKLVYVSSVHAIPEKPKGQVITEVRAFSPDKVDGDYAKTKAEASAIVLGAAARGLDASIVHPSGIIGPYDRKIGHFTQLIFDYCRGRLTAKVAGGYDFVDVRDVAEGIVACAKRGRPGECYLLSNRFCTVGELISALHEITGRRDIKTELPLWFAKGTAPIAELYYKILRQKPLYTPYSLRTLESNAEFSHEKAARELGFFPRSIKSSLADTVEWLTEQGLLKPAKPRKATHRTKRRSGIGLRRQKTSHAR